MSIAGNAALKLIAGNAHPQLAERLAAELDVPLCAAEVGAFADGETRVHVGDDVRHADVYLVQPTCTPVNEHLMVLALLADAVRAAGASRVTGVVPYFGYARQDERDRSGDPRSAQVVGRLLGTVGVDHVITLDLHSPALESALPMPVTHLRADELFLSRVESWNLQEVVVVAPDAGGMKRAQRYARGLGAPLAAIAKHRPRPDRATALCVLGEVRNRDCLIVDDMASTGGTLHGAAEALRASGARNLHAVFTHAVMAPGADERIREAQFAHVLTSDSIPVASESWCEVVAIAPRLARAVHRLRSENAAPGE